MLPLETERVWHFLRDQTSLDGFVLIGGTALALQLGHRISEDLDLIHPGPRLPRRSLTSLTTEAERHGLRFAPQDNVAALEEFTLAGEELHDHQQDFLVNESTKVSFFVPIPEFLGIVEMAPGSPIRVATLGELFRTKSLVTARRSKTRDWLDLYLLLRDHGFTLLDYRDAFLRAGLGDQYESGLQRMCLGQPQRNDEGYEHLLPHPPALSELREFFQQQRDWLERKLAAG